MSQNFSFKQKATKPICHESILRIFTVESLRDTGRPSTSGGSVMVKMFDSYGLKDATARYSLIGKKYTNKPEIVFITRSFLLWSKEPKGPRSPEL